MQKKKIMVVEDDSLLETEIRDFLQRWGYVTVGMGDFQHVVEAFSRECPQLILMDISSILWVAFSCYKFLLLFFCEIIGKCNERGFIFDKCSKYHCIRGGILIFYIISYVMITRLLVKKGETKCF